MVDEDCTDSKDQSTYEASHLKRREIQGPIIVSLIKGFAEEIGHDKAIEVATDVIREDAKISGRKMAEKYGGNTLAELARIVREVWSKDNAMVINVLEETDKNLDFDVTRCGYAESYEKMSIKEFGVCLSCSRDEPFTEGFNPQIRLKRTQTIMEGASHCDFRYTLE